MEKSLRGSSSFQNVTKLLRALPVRAKEQGRAFQYLREPVSKKVLVRPVVQQDPANSPEVRAKRRERFNTSLMA